jgi:hypothetical protein
MSTVYGTAIWRTLVCTVMNMRFSRRRRTSTNSTTISVSLRIPLNRVTFRSPHAGCTMDSHNIHCYLLVPYCIKCSMLNCLFSLNSHSKRTTSVCYTILDIQLFLWPHHILYREPLCDSLTYMIDVKWRQDVRIINYKLAGSDWYLSILVLCLGMRLERLAKTRDATELGRQTETGVAA